jgi:hypothetical protein
LAGRFAHDLRRDASDADLRYVNNLFDRHYGVFGTFFNLEAGTSAASADSALGDDFFSNPRTITPAAPVAAYGGVKVKFWSGPGTSVTK